MGLYNENVILLHCITVISVCDGLGFKNDVFGRNKIKCWKKLLGVYYFLIILH